MAGAGQTDQGPSLLYGLLCGIGLGGFVNHHLLGVHHVRDDLGSPLGWDLAFLGFGAALVASGWFLHLRGAGPAAARSRSRRGAR